MEYDAFLPQNKGPSSQGQDVLVDGQELGKHGYIPLQNQHVPYHPSPPLHPQVSTTTGYTAEVTTDDRQDRVDPYRTALPHHRGSHSPYGIEGFNNSRYSMNSSSGASAVGGTSHQYPMQALNGQQHHGHGSNSHLPSSFYTHQQHIPTGATPTSSVYGERYQDHREGSLVGLTGRPSPLQSNYKAATALGMPGAEEEDEEDPEILQKVAGSNVSRLSKGGRHLPASASVDTDDEEEGQERGAMRRKEAKRCWCCSRRVCVYMSFVIIVILIVVLYFVVPRSPGFSFEAVSSMGDPVITRDQVQEPFSIRLRVDSTENYLPLRLSSIEMTVWIRSGEAKIGNNDGLPSSFVIKPRSVQRITIPMMLDYTSLKIETTTDSVYMELADACTPIPQNSGKTPRGINLVIGGKMKVWGLSWIWKPQFGFNADNVPCPINAREPPPEPTPTPEPVPTTTTSTSSSSSSSVSATSTGSTTTSSATPTGSSSSATPRPT
ncbi:hypothetical protein B0O80DRAFT_431507 [Mortierella sp. GBAus27b]|nr:hypothetical protein B0O80DRAFT_431507 [Mortierella sp. GBAus27b]